MSEGKVGPKGEVSFEIVKKKQPAEAKKEGQDGRRDPNPKQVAS